MGEERGEGAEIDVLEDVFPCGKGRGEVVPRRGEDGAQGRQEGEVILALLGGGGVLPVDCGGVSACVFVSTLGGRDRGIGKRGKGKKGQVTIYAIEIPLVNEIFDVAREVGSGVWASC